MGSRRLRLRRVQIFEATRRESRVLDGVFGETGSMGEREDERVYEAEWRNSRSWVREFRDPQEQDANAGLEARVGGHLRRRMVTRTRMG